MMVSQVSFDIGTFKTNDGINRCIDFRMIYLLVQFFCIKILLREQAVNFQIVLLCDVAARELLRSFTKFRNLNESVNHIVQQQNHLLLVVKIKWNRSKVYRICVNKTYSSYKVSRG